MKRMIFAILLIVQLLLTACNGNRDANIVNSDTIMNDIETEKIRDIDITDKEIKKEAEEMAQKFIEALLIWDEEILLEHTDPKIIKAFNRYPNMKNEFSISREVLDDYDFKMENIEESIIIVDDKIVFDSYSLVSMKSKAPSFTGNYNRYKYDYKISLDIDPYIMRVEEITWDVVPIRLKIN